MDKHRADIISAIIVILAVAVVILYTGQSL